VAGSALGWYAREPLLAALRRPAEQGAKLAGIERLPFRIFDPVGGLMLALTVAAVGGLVLAGPAILTELWLFIRPALHSRERRWFAGMVPLATLFFLAGIAFAYWISTYVFQYIFYINQTMGVEGELTLTSYLSFILKLLLATGLSFELPIIIMALAYVGIVRSEWLVAKWRYLVFAIIVLTLIFTPTNDPLTMGFFAIPLLLLFFLSIWLVRLIERQRAKRLAQEAEEGAKPTTDERGWPPQLRATEGTAPAEPGSMEAEGAEAYRYYEELAKALPEPRAAEETPSENPTRPPSSADLP
jgi:sec-independent protein translocase protein TatC